LPHSIIEWLGHCVFTITVLISVRSMALDHEIGTRMQRKGYRKDAKGEASDMNRSRP
jgi:hypothetical protein